MRYTDDPVVAIDPGPRADENECALCLGFHGQITLDRAFTALALALGLPPFGDDRRLVLVCGRGPGLVAGDGVLDLRPHFLRLIGRRLAIEVCQRRSDPGMSAERILFTEDRLIADIEGPLRTGRRAVHIDELMGRLAP